MTARPPPAESRGPPSSAPSAPTPKPVRRAGSNLDGSPGARAAATARARTITRKVSVGDEVWTMHATGASHVGAASHVGTESGPRAALLRVAPEPPDGGGPQTQYAAYVVGVDLSAVPEEELAAVVTAAKPEVG